MKTAKQANSRPFFTSPLFFLLLAVVATLVYSPLVANGQTPPPPVSGSWELDSRSRPAPVSAADRAGNFVGGIVNSDSNASPDFHEKQGDSQETSGDVFPQSFPDTYFVDINSALSNSGAYSYQEFTISSTQTFIMRFASDYSAQAAIVTASQLQNFITNKAFSGFGTFDKQFGTHSVTLSAGTYYAGVRNAVTTSNRVRLELDYPLGPVPDHSFYDFYFQNAITLQSNMKLWQPFTIQSGYRYFIDGCNSGLDSFIIPESELENFKSGASFNSFTDYSFLDDTAQPGHYEVKLPPGNYHLAFRNTANIGKALTYTAERWVSLTAPPPPPCQYAISPTSQSQPASSATGSVSVTAGTGCTWTATSNASWLSVTSGSGAGNGIVNYSVAANTTTSQRAGTITIAGQTFTVTQAGASSTAPTLQFGAATYQVAEGGGQVTVNVTRLGSSSSTVSVEYATVDNPAAVPCNTANGTAYARCDYASSLDTFSFASGETSKSFTIPIIDDAHIEGTESFSVKLSNPVGVALGAQSTVTVTIVDNDAAGTPNPILLTPLFIRMQYLDFLSREPETGEPWSAVLTRCSNVNNNPACDRILVSSSFFGSPEFRLKGFYAFIFYKVAFGRLPEYAEIVTDMRALTGQTPAETFSKRAAFPVSFVVRQEFRTRYDALANAAFVNGLMDRYGLQQLTTPDPSQPEAGTKVTLTRTDLSNRLGSTGAQALTRAQVLRAIVESDQVGAAEYNNAFVAIQYYGYLRRTPETDGYNAWLRVISQNQNDVRTMINGFMNSSEYRLRFGQP